LTHLYCSKNKLSSLSKLPNTLTHLTCFHNPFNLWPTLIHPNKINTEYAEIICEKLKILDYKIKEIESELNENIISQYNKNMSELKKEIEKILNFKFEIVL
jgi:hypothetical protein